MKRAAKGKSQLPSGKSKLYYFSPFDQYALDADGNVASVNPADDDADEARLAALKSQAQSRKASSEFKARKQRLEVE